jgi:hypothetical protein
MIRMDLGGKERKKSAREKEGRERIGDVST